MPHTKEQIHNIIRRSQPHVDLPQDIVARIYDALLHAEVIPTPPRELGWYWVKQRGGNNYVVAWYAGKSRWHYAGVSYSEGDFEELKTDPLIPPTE